MIAVINRNFVPYCLLDNFVVVLQLPNMKVNPKGAIRYTAIPRSKYPSGSTPAQITKHNMDSTYQLETFLQVYRNRYDDQVSTSMTDKNQ